MLQGTPERDLFFLNPRLVTLLHHFKLICDELSANRSNFVIFSSVSGTIDFIRCGSVVVIIRADRIYVSDQGSRQTSPIVHFLVLLRHIIPIRARPSLLNPFRRRRLRIQIVIERLYTFPIRILIIDVSS